MLSDFNVSGWAVVSVGIGLLSSLAQKLTVLGWLFGHATAQIRILKCNKGFFSKYVHCDISENGSFAESEAVAHLAHLFCDVVL